LTQKKNEVGSVSQEKRKGFIVLGRHVGAVSRFTAIERGDETLKIKTKKVGRGGGKERI